MSRAQIDIVMTAHGNAKAEMEKAATAYDKFTAATNKWMKTQSVAARGAHAAKKAFSGLSENVAKIGLHYALAEKAVEGFKKVLDLGSEGAQFQAQLGLISESLVGAVIEIGNMQKATGSMYSQKTIANFISYQKELGYEMGLTGKELEKLAHRFIRLGKEPNEALLEVNRALAKGEGEILTQMGLVDRAEKVVRNYADSIGQTSENLTIMERRQAFLFGEGGLRESLRGVSDLASENAAAFQKLKTHFADMGLAIQLAVAPVARVLEPVVALLKDLLTPVVVFLNQAFESVAVAVETCMITLDLLSPVIEFVRVSFFVLAGVLRLVNQALNALKKAVSVLTKPFRLAGSALRAMTRGLFGKAKAAKEAKEETVRLGFAYTIASGNLRDFNAAVAESDLVFGSYYTTLSKTGSLLDRYYVGKGRERAWETGPLSFEQSEIEKRTKKYPWSTKPQYTATPVARQALAVEQLWGGQRGAPKVLGKAGDALGLEGALGVVKEMIRNKQAWLDGWDIPEQELSMDTLKAMEHSLEVGHSTLLGWEASWESIDQKVRTLSMGTDELMEPLRLGETYSDRIDYSTNQILGWIKQSVAEKKDELKLLAKQTVVGERLWDLAKLRSTTTVEEYNRRKAIVAHWEQVAPIVENIVQVQLKEQASLQATEADLLVRGINLRGKMTKIQGEILLGVKKQNIEREQAVKIMDAQAKYAQIINALTFVGMEQYTKQFRDIQAQAIEQIQRETQIRIKEAEKEVQDLKRRISGAKKKRSVEKDAHEELMKELREELAQRQENLRSMKESLSPRLEIINLQKDKKQELARLNSILEAEKKRNDGHLEHLNTLRALKKVLGSEYDLQIGLLGVELKRDQLQRKMAARREIADSRLARKAPIMSPAALANQKRAMAEMEKASALADIAAQRESLTLAGINDQEALNILKMEENAILERHKTLLQEIKNEEMEAYYTALSGAVSLSSSMMSGMDEHLGKTASNLGMLSTAVSNSAIVWMRYSETQKGGVEAVKSMAQQMLPAATAFIDSVEAKAAIMAIYETGMGFATWPSPESYAHFAAAAIFGGIGVHAAVSGGAAEDKMEEAAASPEGLEGGGGGNVGTIVINMGAGVVLGTPTGIAGAINESLNDGYKTGYYTDRL